MDVFTLIKVGHHTMHSVVVYNYLFSEKVCYNAANVATKKSQNFPTVAMFTFSSGECGKRMVGPNEIMSISG